MDFKDSDGLKQKAVAALKVSKDKINQETDALNKEGISALETKDYNPALDKLNKALAISPENGDARSYKERAERELRIEMKNLYADSVIEENLGNIDLAKKKWRTILEQNISTDSYFQKAKAKLGKYEK